MKAVLIVHSYHHGNTRKVADAMAKQLGAEVYTTETINPTEATQFDLIGLGAGIDTGKHYAPLLEFAAALPESAGQQVFVFSTAGIAGSEKKMLRDHEALHEILERKGYSILGDFACKGHDTVGFLKHIGGINKGRPNDDDLKAASRFAASMLEKIG